MKPARLSKNYGISHQGRGWDYHRKFDDIPYRKMIWEYERRFIKAAIHDHLRSRRIIHLDFACGTGRIISFLEKYATRSTGIDIASSMLDVARTQVKTATLIHGDIHAIPTTHGEKYNLITAFRFFPNAEMSLRENVIGKLSEVLDDKGILIFNNHRNRQSLTFMILRLLGRKYDASGLTHREIKAFLKKANMKIKSTYHVGVFPMVESRTIMPVYLLDGFENIATRIPLLRRFAANVIYVCQNDAE